MGQLIDGVWTESDVRVGAKSSRGEFIRKPVTFRGKIEKASAHPPVSGRYHLYISYACPWAHRTLITRALKGLQDHISFSVVSPYMLTDGWSFLKDYDDLPSDPINNFNFLREVYIKADPKFTGRVTVPVLWDTETKTIVNNESSEIIRIFNSEFNSITGSQLDLCPPDQLDKINQWNEYIYNGINNGVYRCGFARSQEAYNEAFDELFTKLNHIEKHLEQNRFLCGEELTEADVRLFPTLIRFDSVYHTHFKCNGKLIREYKNLNRYTNEILNIPGVKDTVNMAHIKSHYYYSHESINPSRIVAKGPVG